MRSVLLVVAVLTLGGCATVLGGKGPVGIPTASTPPGADVYLDGNRLGTTPVRVEVPRKKAHTLVFKKQGYKDATCILDKKTGAGWVILDVITGIVPVVIDAVTGDWAKASGDCNVRMDPA